VTQQFGCAWQPCRKSVERRTFQAGKTFSLRKSFQFEKHCWIIPDVWIVCFAVVTVKIFCIRSIRSMIMYSSWSLWFY